jgi:hypothetical protein
MQDIPKIVRERLKVAVPVDHPDTNVLTAFAEHSLLAAERQTVLAHLSRCVDCREIVALALPPSDAMQPVVVPSRAGWLTWPALRWGFAAVGVVAIASVGLIQYQRRGSETAARMQTLAPPVVTQQAKTEAPAPIPAVPAPEEAGKPASSSIVQGKAVPLPAGATRRAPVVLDDTAAPSPSAHSSLHLPQRGAAIGGTNLGGPVQNNGVFNNGQFANQRQNDQFHGAIQSPQSQLTYSTNPQPTTPTAIPSTAQPIHVESCCADKAPSAGAELAQNQPVAPALQNEAKVISRSKAPEITAVEVASASPVAETSDKDASRQDMPKAVGEGDSGRSLPALVTVNPASQPRWTISPSGSLQRSFDQGSTWQDVNVTASLVPTSNFDSYAPNAITSLAKSQPAKKEKHARKQDFASPVFRAVTVAGSDVWAGGSNAALYHSMDAGNHWMRVVPSSSGAILAGDVIALEFLDSQHGKVTTSAAEVWSTADAGQTWQKH